MASQTNANLFTPKITFEFQKTFRIMNDIHTNEISFEDNP
jgi:hypothetical protein